MAGCVYFKGVHTIYRQTDRQTNSLTPDTGVCGFFISVKFDTSLLASLAGGKRAKAVGKLQTAKEVDMLPIGRKD